MSSALTEGQTSFEMIIIATLAIIIILGAFSVVPAFSASTGKIAVLKSAALELLSEEDQFYYIAEIREPITYGGTPHKMCIFIGNAEAGAEWNALKAKLIDLGQNLVDAKLYVDSGDIDILPLLPGETALCRQP